MARRGFLGLGGLWLRLAVAFVVVAVTALVVDTALVASGLGADITAVTRRQEADLARTTALSAGAAYQDVGWARADLNPVFNIANRAGAAVLIRDRPGRVVGSSSGYSSYPTARQRRLPVVAVRHRPHRAIVVVGQITVRFGPRGLGALASMFIAERLRARIIAAIAAALLALVMSVVAARLITAPIEVVLTAMRARAAGNRGYRIANLRAPGVLSELLEGFNRAADTLDAIDRARRNLVADVAHEVRTPVAILQAETEAMIDGLAEPTAEHLASLHSEVLRLARMVDGLQRLAAAESAGLQLNRQRHDLAEVTADVMSRFADAFASADVTLNQRLDPIEVRCDRDRIQDVVSNLLTNALKFTPAGGTVTVQTERKDDQHAIVRVSDTGVGIPAAELPRVTDRFFRGRRSTDMASGSGIGMAIVSELVRAHHGDLVISSEEGRGTQVSITLPVSHAGDPRIDALAAGYAVGHFAEQVDVAVVAGGLLDQVEQDPAQRDRFGAPVQFTPGRQVQVERSDEVPVLVATGPVLGEQFGDRLLDADTHLPIGIFVGPRGLAWPPEQRCLEPGVLHPAQMTDQPSDRHQG